MSRHVLVALAIALFLSAGCRKEDELASGRISTKGPQLGAPKRPSLLDREVVDSIAPAAGFDVGSTPTSIAANTDGSSGLMSFGSIDLGTTGLARRSFDGLGMSEADDEVAPLDLRLIEANLVSGDYKERFDRGQAYFEKGDVTQALLCFHEAQEIDNKNFAAYVGEAMCYSQLQEYGKAQAAIDFAIRAAPQNVGLYGTRAMIRYRKRDLQGCVDDFSRILAANPKDYVCLLNRAHVFMQMNNFKAAVEDFTLILNDNPTAADCLLNRAVSYFRLERWSAAAADAEAVVKLLPQTMDAHFVQAISYARMGKPEVGRPAFEEAVRLGLSKKTADSWEREFYPGGKP